MSRRSIVFPGANCHLVEQSNRAWADVLVLERHAGFPAITVEADPRAHVLLLHLGETWIGLEEGDRTKWARATPGSVSVVEGGAGLAGEPATSAPFLAAAIRPMFVASVANRGGTALGPLRSVAGVKDAGIAHVLQALGAELSQDCPAGSVYWTSLATVIAMQLLRGYALDPPETAPHAGGLAPARLERVLLHINAHLHQELRVSDLAVLAGLSVSHFSMAFRESTGMPPYRYAMHVRVRQAKQMLTDPLRPIADIAYALGYSSQAHFTTMFRRMTGMSPGVYRSSVEGGSHRFPQDRETTVVRCKTELT